MKSIYLAISDFTIELFLHPTEYEQTEAIFLSQLKKYYKGFMLEKQRGNVDFTIHITQENISQILKYKKNNYIEFYSLAGSDSSITSFYSISIPQLAQLFQQIVSHLLKGRGFFLHGSAVVSNGKVLMFLGPSGQGKSTMVTLLRHTHIPFVDDILIIRKKGERYFCYQSPILDKQPWIKKISQGYSISNVYILKQSRTTYKENHKSLDLTRKIMEELVSDRSTIKVYTKLFLEFMSSCISISTLNFSKNRKDIIKTIG